ncbi:MAG: squalene/phytoene synthase family protein [Hyphomicrobiaceae bacterium]
MRYEPDRYIAATLAPPNVRPTLAAIAAFAAEIARIPSLVSEPLLGEIRLQWWHDALAEGRRGRLSGHPVADALIAAANQCNLPSDLLDAVVDARELDLAGGMPQDDAGLEAYLKASEGDVFLLSFCALGGERRDVEDVARLAGYAYGISRALCRLPILLHNGGMILPADRLKRAGIDPAQLASQPVPQPVNDAVRRVANEMQGEALKALARARAQAVRLDARLRPVLLPLAMVGPYFQVQSNRRILIEPAEISPVRRVVRIGLAHLTGRV